MDERLRPTERIRRRRDFQQVYAEGARASGRYLTLIVRRNDLGVSRLGIVATKKLGGAVRRNRAKRLIREVFRRAKPEVGLDIVVVLRPEAVTASLAELDRDYRNVLRRSCVRALRGPLAQEGE